MRSRVALITALVGLGLLLPGQSAHAHALLKSSEPADGSQLTSSPDQILLTFTEDPDPSLSSVHVYDANGNEVEKGSARAVPGHPNELSLQVSGLAKGVYTVAWRTTSRVDGHTTAGALAFGIGVSPAGATLPKTAVVKTPSPSVLSVVGKWLFYCGLFLLLGVAATMLWVFGSGVRAPPRLLAGGWIAAFVGLAAFAEAQRADAGVGLSHVFGSSIGHAVIARAIPLVIAFIGVLLVPRRRNAGLLTVLVGAALTVGAHVYEGHAAVGSWRIGKVLLQSGHVIVGGIWIGGLVAMLFVIRAMEPSERQRIVGRFSALALWLVVLLGLSGVGRAINEIDSWHGLFSTSYGQLVIAKAALLGVLIVLGAVNRYRNVPRAGEAPSGLRRFVSSELVVAAAVLALTGILSGVAPARSIRAAAAPSTSVVATGSDFGTTVKLRLTATPGTAGSNTFELKASDFDTGAPVSARVSLRFKFLGPVNVGDSTLQMTRAGSVYRAKGTNLSIGGVWTVTAVIQRGVASVEVPLTVATRVSQQVSVSAAPGQPTIYTVGLTEGRSVQFYADPGKAGANEIHATFFDKGGVEFKDLHGYSVLATPPGGQPMGLDYRQLAQGHIVSDAQLTQGKWRFDVWAQTRKGELLWSYFEPTIG